ncbi:MAG: class F sortase [Streptosporangiaceae bacterium]
MGILRKLCVALIAASMAAGLVLAFVGSHTLRWSPPPLPPRSEALPGVALPAGSPSAGQARHPGPVSYPLRPMARSAPLSLAIPRIGIRAKIIPLGLRPDGSPAVPPLTTPFVTSWYDPGPTPGAPGAAVIFGHVDSAAVGPAVFYNLGRLRTGDRVDVTLADRRTAVFRVYGAGLYLKTDFPSLGVYGYTRWPTLRLVTCGGEFDRRTGQYLGNVVVFAEYVGERG